MRDLIYLSTAKLEQFIDERWSISASQVSAELEISFLQAVRLKLAGGNPQAGTDRVNYRAALKKIERVLRVIDNSDNPALWYEDPDVSVGSWIQFEGIMRYGIVYPAIIAITDKELGGSKRTLVLHGSSRHALPIQAGAHSPSMKLTPTRSRDFMRVVLKWASTDRAPTMTSSLDAELSRRIVAMARRDFDTARLAGFARVTETGGAVYATPLYIERV